jgi:HlyD family secretion protein
MASWKKITLIGIGALVVGGIVYKKFIAKPPAIQVAIVKAEKKSITQTVNGTGKIYPEVEVKISPDVSGEIIDLTVKEGDSVRKGQVVGRIYGELLELQRQQASAQVNQASAGVGNTAANLQGVGARLAQATSNYNTYKKLFEDGVISRIEFQQYETTFKAAQSEYNAVQKTIQSSQAQVVTAKTGLEQANKNLNRTTIYASMDGIVSVLNVKKGERVVGTAQMAGTEMMRIADMRTLETVIDVSENDIPKVKVGDSAEIEIDAYRDRKFMGLVTQIGSSSSNIASPNSGQVNDVTNYKVKVRILTSSYSDLIVAGRSFPLRPGMTTSVFIKTETRKDVLAIPIAGLTTRESKEKEKDKPLEDDRVVFIYDESTKKVKKKIVKTGIQDIDYIEITEGLKGGEQIVTEPFVAVNKNLEDDMTVKVVDKEKLLGDDKADKK